MTVINQKLLGKLMASVAEDDQVDIHSAGGKIAGSWLLPPSQEDHIMPNRQFATSLRDRLRVSMAAFETSTSADTALSIPALCVMRFWTPVATMLEHAMLGQVSRLGMIES